MKRHDFIFAGGVMAAWPLVAGAQGPAMPVIGVLFGLSDNNPEHHPSSMRSSTNYAIGLESPHRTALDERR